jgi:hypothetical protein
VLTGFLVDPVAVEALRYFVTVVDRGAPLLASSLAIALRQAVLWREVYNAGLLGGIDAYRLAQALDNVERAGRYAVSGGGFARFVSPDATISPELVLGVRKRRTVPMAAM